MDAATSVKMLWKHSDSESTGTFKFKSHVEEKYHVDLPEYEDLRQWSLNDLGNFWEEVWRFTQIQASKPFIKVPWYQ